MPGIERRELLRDLDMLARHFDRQEIPGHEGDISICRLVPDKIFGPGLLQMTIDNAPDALDFVAVTVDSRSDALLRVNVGEPEVLTCTVYRSAPHPDKNRAGKRRNNVTHRSMDPVNSSGSATSS